MNYVDVILLMVIALAVWAGWKKGFILGTVNLVIWIGSLLAGFIFYQQVGGLLQGLGERLRLSPRGDAPSNGSQPPGRAGKSPASTDVEPSRSA